MFLNLPLERSDSQLQQHISALSGPGGPGSPGDVAAAAAGLADLLGNGADISPAFSAIRQTVGKWSEYAAGPGMWSDNYSEDEQEREQYGPLIISRLLMVLSQHALRSRDSEFIAVIISETRLLSFFYEIVGDMMAREGDSTAVLAPLIDYTIEQVASSSSDAHAYDLLCAIQNLSYPMARANPCHRREYAKHILNRLNKVKPSQNWRAFVGVQLGEVQRTYEKLIAEADRV